MKIKKRKYEEKGEVSQKSILTPTCYYFDRYDIQLAT